MNPEEEVIEESPEEVPEESPEVPEVPEVDVVHEIEDFIDPTPEDVVDKQDIVIYLQQKENELLIEQHEQSIEKEQELIDKIQLLIDQGETGSSTLGDINGQIIEKLDGMLDYQSQFVTGNNTLITYGTIYIPFLVICVLLWRFFATFLRSAR